ncbi:hypothetical protein [Bradyrhizobium liaoningense]
MTKARLVAAPFCLLGRRHSHTFAVIARESGQSSIPETPVLESRSRGVLDAPVKPGHDGGDEATHSTVIASQRVRAKRGPMTGSAKIPWGVDSDRI